MPKTSTPLIERINRRVQKDPNTGCWLWTGTINSTTGYGTISVDAEVRSAHRLSYELHIGPIPAGLQIDHLCRVRHCVNPDHMEPVTQRENLLRSPIAPAGVNARKTHCPQGHPYSEENTIWQRSRRGRLCRICQAKPRAGQKRGA